MITCLGLEFADEAARREHFRNLLREKLPELKKIEGYPIGEDEDILALSDPPYYTACPNPWLNDFVAEWEKEKTALEAAGKRSKEAEIVREPYASDVSEGKNNPIYNAHSYHTKVPHPAIMRYILHYTQPGDVVLDGFAGTGMTGVAAQLCGAPDAETKLKIEKEWRDMFGKTPNWGVRRAILGDLSPIASFIAYNYNTPVDVEHFEAEAKRILAEVEEECGWMYETTHSNDAKGVVNFVLWSDVFLCSSCGNEVVFWDSALNATKDTILEVFNCPRCLTSLSKNSIEKARETSYCQALSKPIIQTKTVPVVINYSVRGKRFEKKPDDQDLRLIKAIEERIISDWFPKDLMMGIGEEWGDTWRAGVHAEINYVFQLHTTSNLACLSRYWAKATEAEFSSQLRLAASAANPNFSKLRRYRTDKKGGGPLAGTLYIASLTTPQNPIKSIERNAEYCKKAFEVTRHFPRKFTAIYIGSASQMNASRNSVDYIFTDPPFGANLMYSELNFLWEAWLKVKTNNKHEAIENKSQGKTLLDYQAIMTDCFREYFRVLKPGKWMTVEFSNTGAAVWNGIQTAIQRAGFVIANVAALDKQQGSFKAVTTPTAVKQDLVISCYKPSQDFELAFAQSKGEVAVWDFVGEHLRHLPVHLRKGGATTAIIERSPKILYDRLITFYLMRGLPVPIDAAPFQAGLRQRFNERDGMYFLPEQAAEYDAKKAAAPEMLQMALLVTNEGEGILWLREELKKPQTYSELQPKWMQSITAWRKGDAQPELRQILEENFIMEAEGKWRTPNTEEAADREILRNKALLREYARYEEAIKGNKPKKLKEVRVEALRAGFKAAWERQDYAGMVRMGDYIPQAILLEDEALLLYYDMARDRV